jgi:DNA-directed RNA polymerase subunit RPC12/RpoP
MFKCLSCSALFEEPDVTRYWSSEYGPESHSFCPYCGEEEDFEEMFEEED